MERLGDIATYINGYAFKPSDWSDEGLEIIRIQNLTGNAYEINRFKGDYNKKYEVNNGDVLISWSASLGVYVWNKGKAILNQHIFKVVFDKIDVNKDFFIFQVENLLERASSEVHGATMKHLTKPVFDSLPFYLPNKEKQNTIAYELKTISRLIAKHHKQLEDYEILVKSRFIEMFGDKDYPHKKLAEVACIGSSKRIYANEYVSEGVPFYRSKEIRELGDGKRPSVELFISSEKYNFLKDRFGVPKKGDILIAAIGATIGYMWIINTDNPFYYKDGNLILISDFRELNSIYLEFVLKKLISKFKEQGAAGSAQLALTIEKVEKMEVAVPPIELQNQFADFVAQVDKSKLAVQQSLNELETLKKSLMQQYFG